MTRPSQKKMMKKSLRHQRVDMNFYKISNLDVKMIYIENEKNTSLAWMGNLFNDLRFFARSRAEKYSGFNKKDDVLQESYLGLWTAIQSFDYSKNFDFYRWAHWNISSKIKNFLSLEAASDKAASALCELSHRDVGLDYSPFDAALLKDFIRKSSLKNRDRRVLVDIVIVGKTLKEVGSEIGLSEERVRQIKESSISRLRSELER